MRPSIYRLASDRRRSLSKQLIPSRDRQTGNYRKKGEIDPEIDQPRILYLFWPPFSPWNGRREGRPVDLYGEVGKAKTGVSFVVDEYAPLFPTVSASH